MSTTCTNTAYEHETMGVASAAGSAERDTKGRFAKGNRGGPGNPFGCQIAYLRKSLVDAVKAEDFAAIAVALLNKAREGDVAAARLLFQYVLGACPRIGRRSPKISLDSLGFGLSASAQPSARTAPLNVRRRSRRDARSSEDCA
jgi:hypothetical protein